MIEAPAIDDHLPRSLEMRGGAQGGFDVTGGARAYLKTVREHLESLLKRVIQFVRVAAIVTIAGAGIKERVAAE